MRVIISPKAEVDLAEIWNYGYRKWFQQQADKYFSLLVSNFEFIAVFPNLGISIENIEKGFFYKNIASLRVFYRIIKMEKIEVIRVLHQRMDINKNLQP